MEQGGEWGSTSGRTARRRRRPRLRRRLRRRALRCTSVRCIDGRGVDALHPRRYGWEYTKLHNADIQAGKLRQKFDAIIVPDQRANAIVDGCRGRRFCRNTGRDRETGSRRSRSSWRRAGRWWRSGRRRSALEKMPLPVKDLKKTYTRDQHFAPGDGGEPARWTRQIRSGGGWRRRRTGTTSTRRSFN